MTIVNVTPGVEHVWVEVLCPECASVSVLTVPRLGYDAWRGGELIQRALPLMSVVEREQLITGFCGGCFDALFKPEFEDEEAAQ